MLIARIKVFFRYLSIMSALKKEKRRAKKAKRDYPKVLKRTTEGLIWLKKNRELVSRHERKRTAKELYKQWKVL